MSFRACPGEDYGQRLNSVILDWRPSDISPMRLRGFRSAISMRTEWIVILTIYAVALPVLTGWAALRVTQQTIESDTLASLTGSSRAFRDAVTQEVTHHEERMRSVLRLVDAACGVSGVLNEDCVQDEMQVLLDEGASDATLRYPRRKGVRSINTSKLSVGDCDKAACIFRDEVGNRGLYSVTQRDERTGMVLNVAWPLEPLLRANISPSDASAVVHWPGNENEVVGRTDTTVLIPADELNACMISEQAKFVADSRSYRVLIPTGVLPGVCGVSFVRADAVLKQGRVRSALVRIVLVFVGVSLILGFLISFTTTRALRELRDRMKLTKSGKDLLAKRKRRGPAEVRELAVTFDRMMHSLRLSQKALMESEQKLSMAYHAANMWVWEHHISDGRIIVRNPSTEQPTTETSLRSVLREVHPEDRHAVLSAIRLAMQTGTYSAEYRTRRDGEYLWASSWGQMVEGGQVLMGVSADVTSMKESERFRAERERLVATTEMSASLAHEINNPLAAVTGSIYMAEQTESNDPELKHYLNIASIEARRIAEIVRRLLQLHRTSTAPMNFDVVKLWTDLIEGSAERLRKKGNTVELSAAGPAQVVGYMDELRHGFGNLLTNAMEFSKEGAPILVRIRPAHSIRSGVRGVRVMLCDFGEGIPQNRVEELFKPFATTKREKGRGLGLWVTRAAVLKQGGDIRIREMRSPVRGTCVRIFIPNRPAGMAA